MAAVRLALVALALCWPGGRGVARSAARARAAQPRAPRAHLRADEAADAPRHERWMARAIALAERGRRTAPPNPWVGCVIVGADGETVLGEGYHVTPGASRPARARRPPVARPRLAPARARARAAPTSAAAGRARARRAHPRLTPPPSAVRVAAAAPGGPHAEAAALADARARGVGAAALAAAVLYCTLEPCHAGPGKRTPACDAAIVGAGIRTVFVAQVCVARARARHSPGARGRSGAQSGSWPRRGGRSSRRPFPALRGRSRPSLPWLAD
jgi:pyrimidine deaminase RibD-like protein